MDTTRSTFEAAPFSAQNVRHVFFGDEGAIYWVGLNGLGEKVVEGTKTRIEYRSESHAVRITGKRRWQGGQAGNGSRAVLTLDTGEGLVEIKGVLR